MLKLVISLLEALNGERRLICEPINTFWDINLDLADEPRKTLVKLTVQIHVLTARLMVAIFLHKSPPPPTTLVKHPS